MPKRPILFLLIWIAVLVFWALPALAEMIVDTAWVRRYNGPVEMDHANAIALDDSGNVYVTGKSWGSGSNWDYATIKYYSNGDTAWARRYNGPGSQSDIAEAIAVDNWGNTYVTGRSYGSGTALDYATMKYYPAGDAAWVRRYNGPGNWWDWARAIAVDGSGNVYVTGSSYDSLTLDDYATLKYDPSGDTAWVRRYNGPGNTEDDAYAIAVDDSGSVYVTGSAGTIKYDAGGNQQWHGTWGGTNIAVDILSNVYITGESADDYQTVKYYPNGDTAWLRRYDGPGNSNDEAYAIAIDSSGNVYVTGWSTGMGTDYDYATIKYYPNGDTAWVRRYDGPGNGWDYGIDIALDRSGNIYVTGTTLDSVISVDHATIKYDPYGATAWLKRYDGPGNGNDAARAIAVDESSNVYVTGDCYVGEIQDWDYVTIKYFQSLRGDCNRDGIIDIADVVYLINYLFIDGPAPVPLEAGDANCDGLVDIADVVYLINYLFINGPPPSC